MIIWEQTPNGYIECIVDDCYGVVGLAHPRTGWTARLAGPRGATIAPTLFHTAAEARAWVERRIEESCSELSDHPAPEPRTSSAAAQSNPFAKTAVVWARALGWAARRVVARHQHWNALYLDPRHYGQQPLCHATLQSRR